MSESKYNIRKEMISKRKNLSAADVTVKSGMIYNIMINLDVFSSSDNILTYYPINNEVSTLKLFTDHKNKNLYLPKVQANRNLSIHKVNCLEELHPGSFGIFEPCNDGIGDFGIIDLVLVPLIAFDNSLHRIGYGGGYYDKLLKKMPHSCKIGLAYEMQKIENIELQHHDVPLDMIITENNIYYQVP